MNSVLTESKSVFPHLFNGHVVLSYASIKQNILLNFFSKNSNLDESGKELPSFSSRTDLKFDNVTFYPKLFNKVISGLFSSKASSADGISVMVR